MRQTEMLPIPAKANAAQPVLSAQRGRSQNRQLMRGRSQNRRCQHG